MDNALDQINDLVVRMGRSIIGQKDVVERLVIGILANGNLLVEGLPGLAKTRAIKALATNMDADFNRVQFTPDLLPSDVTGSEVYYAAGGKGEFRFEPGPIFANIVLADEINRAPAKVQAALLEAMEERQVTVAGTTHALPPLFMVMATQNPIEQEGTYPLPEAQMDRFLMKVLITYPLPAEEGDVIELVRDEERHAAGLAADGGGDGEGESKPPGIDEPIQQDAVFAARRDIAQLHVSDAIKQYIVDVVWATREPGRYSEDLARWIEVGASPRASLSLDRASRAYAWMKGHDFVGPEDVRAIMHDVLRHRIALTYEAQGEGMTTDRIIDDIIVQVALP